MSKLSIYIHVPFCAVKCSYCAFNIYTHLEYLILPYIQALKAEIIGLGKQATEYQVHTIYFGGGTPTLLNPAQFADILSAIYQHFDVAADVEISTEANPDDLAKPEYCHQLRDVGIARLSIGVQSANQSELELFGRVHDVDAVAESVAFARAANFDNINLDLIYGIPNQTLMMWEHSLQTVIDLGVDHLSLYALGIEPKTAMAYWIENDKLPEPDDDLTADMYDLATDRLAVAGLNQYEISNWSKIGYESRHNLQYWRNLPYLGLGPGAHGYANGVRTVVARTPRAYITRMESSADSAFDFPRTPATDEIITVSRDDEISETIMMGMRMLSEGVRHDLFESRFGISLLAYRKDTIQQFVDQHLLTVDNDAIRFTQRGRLVSNRILRDLI